QWWDHGKVLIQQLCREYTVNITRDITKSLKDLEIGIVELQALAESTGDRRHFEDLKVKKALMADLLETWLSDRVPDTAIQLDELTVFHADRNAALCGKTRGGGLCVYINAEWCKNSVLVSSYCSSLVDFVTVRCRPFYLPRDFTTIFIVGVYIPPRANAKEALCELYGAISELQNAHPDGLFIIAGDFNHASLFYLNFISMWTLLPEE
ncbi:hypothetical protein QTP86_027794, partial [Hemibagrus guttatus]